MTTDSEMRNLVLHAADLLDACQPMANADIVEDITSTRSHVLDAYRNAIQEIAAITTARTVLRMVAACMSVQDAPAASAAPTDRADEPTTGAT